jgi:Zn-dependent protease with chaperone function
LPQKWPGLPKRGPGHYHLPVPLCPACQIPLVTERSAVPWCERCEFQLDYFKLSNDLAEPWRSIARENQRRGFASDRQLGRSGAEVASRTASGLVALRILSVLIYALGAGLLAAGVWCLAVGQNPVLGLVFLPLSLLFLPKLGRVRPLTAEAYTTSAANRPAFFKLIERVAEACQTPMPDIVALSDDWNAFTAVVGLKRKRLLVIGIPLWAALTPQERVALLAHELGHLANEDSARHLLIQPAVTQFGRLARFLQGISEFSRGSVYMVAWQVTAGLLGRALWTVHLGLNTLGQAESRRIEVRADLIAARVAGTKATSSMLDVLACAPELLPQISVYTEDDVLKSWHEGVQWARGELTGRIARLRQLSNRTDADLFSSHPSAGRRHEFLGRVPYQDAAIVLTGTEAERIDRELNPYAEKFRSLNYELIHGI